LTNEALYVAPIRIVRLFTTKIKQLNIIICKSRTNR